MRLTTEAVGTVTLVPLKGRIGDFDTLCTLLHKNGLPSPDVEGETILISHNSDEALYGVISAASAAGYQARLSEPLDTHVTRNENIKLLH